ncbi:MAG TPA: MoaD/ThiS family protein [Bacteroidia bacterium]|jgi:molybdopterin converting factor small subunit|nr:MoaD/ThiS family protein [Bacteroidia bacterium]
MKVLFFGPLAEITGSSQLELESCGTTDKLYELILRQYPEMKNKSIKLALNQELVAGNMNIQAGDELAVMAPFAGG